MKVKTMSVNHLILLSIFVIISTRSIAQQGDTTWRLLPIRSIEEFNMDAFGGEGEQHPHSLSRCYQHPEYIYLSHDVGGSWRSTDNGDTWEKNLDKGLFLGLGQSIAVDPVDPDIVMIILDERYNYLAPDYQGLYRSEDGGENWEFVLQKNLVSERMNRHNIEFDRTAMNGDEPVKTWYAALMGNGLYRSEDGGKTWTENPLSSLEDHGKVYQVKTHPADSMIVFVATESGLFKSTNEGEGLSRVEALPENVTSLEINPIHPDSIFATVQNDGLYLSVDSGVSFERIRSHDAIRLHMNPGFPEQIYLVGNNKNSLVSHDGGATWESLPEATTFPGLGRETGWRRWIDKQLSCILPNPEDKNEAVFNSRSTLFKTTDAASTIHESATGWTGNAWTWTDNAAVFDRFDSSRFAFFCCDVGTRITTTGGDWFHANTNPQAGTWYQQGKIGWYGTYAGDFYPEAGSETMVACIGDYFHTQLMRTENLGKSWTLVTEGDAAENMNLFVAFNPEDPNIVYAGNKYSTDGGKTFTPFIFPGSHSNSYVIGMCNAYPDVIFALDHGCYAILRSCDRGQHWEVYVKPGWRFRYFDSLPTFAADPLDPSKVYTLDRNHDLASYDGEKWTSFNVMDHVDIDIPHNYVRNVAVDPNDPNIIYAGTFVAGTSKVFRTMDGGETWEDISYNLSRMGGAMKVNPHTGELYRGSMFGTWIFPAPYDEVPVPNPEDYKFSMFFSPDSVTLIEGDSLQLNLEFTLSCLEDVELFWSSSDTTVAMVDESGEVTGVAEGTCTVTATGESEYLSADCEIIVESNPVGIRSDQDSRFNVFADSNDRLHLTFPDEVVLSGIRVYNLLGEAVLVQTYNNILPVRQKQLDVSGLTDGFYILSVTTTGGSGSRKILLN